MWADTYVDYEVGLKTELSQKFLDIWSKLLCARPYTRSFYISYHIKSFQQVYKVDLIIVLKLMGELNLRLRVCDVFTQVII